MIVYQKSKESDPYWWWHNDTGGGVHGIVFGVHRGHTKNYQMLILYIGRHRWAWVTKRNR